MFRFRLVRWTCASSALIFATACQFEGDFEGLLEVGKHGGGHFNGNRCDAGCKDARPPEADTTVVLTATATIFAVCDRTNVAYDVTDVRRSTGEIVNNPVCHWAFDDGQTADDCRGGLSFACAGQHTALVDVTDPEIGATVSITAISPPLVDPLALYIKAEAPPCGLWFQATGTLTGGHPGGFVEWRAFPSEYIEDGPIISADRRINVTAPGTYEIWAKAEEFGSSGEPICGVSATTHVNVVACDGGTDSVDP